MRLIDSSELKKLQLGILDYFDAFCKRNGIKYWLDYGTLLGAIRHKGFIPWDDDIDISMLRDDYMKASSIFNSQSDGTYQFQTPVNDKNCCYPFGKLIDTRTVLQEYGDGGIKTGVYIDVFVYDNAPEDKNKAKKVFKRRDFLGRVRRLQLPMRDGLIGLKRTAYLFGSFILSPIPRGFINTQLDKNARKYEKIKTEMVSSFVDPYDPTYFIVPKSTFRDLIEVDFEGKRYPVPQAYDYWLKVLYGNYMELPPVEKRIAQHSFEAYYIN